MDERDDLVRATEGDNPDRLLLVYGTPYKYTIEDFSDSDHYGLECWSFIDAVLRTPRDVPPKWDTNIAMPNL